MSTRREERGADGFTVLDLELAHLVHALAVQDSAFLALAAALVSRQRRLGHPCLLLEEWAGRAHGVVEGATPQLGLDLPDTAPEQEAWSRLLRASGVVACTPDEQDRHPLVLEDGRLYLQRMHAAESRVAAALRARAMPMDPPEGLAGLVESVAPERDSDPLQRLAVDAVFHRSLHVLTGGPGTGKTSTVGRMLAVALALHPHLRIRLAAPTGKAAARLQEALGECLKWLPEALRPAVAGLPRATTLHRLLHEAPPLDWLVVDEASMVDLGLMDRVLAFLPHTSRLLLVGDADQLASVDAGAVLHQVVEGLSAWRDTPPQESPPVVTTLTTSRRFGPHSSIGRLATAVRKGDAEDALATLRMGGQGLSWIQRDQAAASLAFSTALRQGLLPFCQADDAGEALAALDRFRVICGRRTGPLGVEAMNQWCRRRLLESGECRFRPVLIRVNDHVLGLANGDSGVQDMAPGKGSFHFQAGGIPLQLVEAQVPSHDEAWAITVHQSQGSEAEEILLVLPEEASPLLTRELLYTGLTRARKRLVVVATEKAIRQAVEQVTRRAGGLGHKLVPTQGFQEGRS